MVVPSGTSPGAVAEPGALAPAEGGGPSARVRAARLKYAEPNRNLSVGLGGTCVVILTFLLLFLYGGAEAHGYIPWLFQLTLAVIVSAMFFFSFAGTTYFTVMGYAETGDPKASAADQRAFLFFGVGILLLSVVPALILFTAEFWVVGGLALAFWVAFLAVLAHTWYEWSPMR